MRINRGIVPCLLLSYIILLQLLLPSLIFAEAGRVLWPGEGSIEQHLISVIDTIHERAFYRPDNQNIITAMLKAYIMSFDPDGDYLDKDEYTAIKALQKGDYGDAGMDITSDVSGRLLCSPHPEGPAKRAGVENGDVLVAVDGITVSGKPVYFAELVIMGVKGSPVTLVFEKNDGARKEVTMKRTPMQSYSLKIDTKDGFRVVHIYRFTNRTRTVLENTLKKQKDSCPIVIDLRRNSGGNFSHAIDCAMLFLNKDQKIVDRKNDKGLVSFKNTKDPINTTSLLYVWQDQKTAGAAEVFTAALVHKKRAVSIGKQSRGKGTYQEFIELSSGSALKLTTACMKTPDGTFFDKQGLKPTFVLDKQFPEENDYWQKTTELHKAEGITERTPGLSEEKGFAAVETPLQEDYFICFDKEFDSVEDAELWALVVKNSLDDPPDQFLLEIHTDDIDRTRYIVCLGPFVSEGMGVDKISHISEEIKVPMYVEMSDKNNKQMHHAQTERKKDSVRYLEGED